MILEINGNEIEIIGELESVKVDGNKVKIVTKPYSTVSSQPVPFTPNPVYPNFPYPFTPNLYPPIIGDGPLYTTSVSVTTNSSMDQVTIN